MVLNVFYTFLFHIKKTNSHSQLQDQDDLGLVFKDFVQRDDVRVLDLLQDVHLALDVLPRHPSSARLAAPFLDEFGGELHTCSPVSASSDHSKLTAADGNTESAQQTLQQLISDRDEVRASQRPSLRQVIDRRIILKCEYKATVAETKERTYGAI